MDRWSRIHCSTCSRAPTSAERAAIARDLLRLGDSLEEVAFWKCASCRAKVKARLEAAQLPERVSTILRRVLGKETP